MYPGLLGHRLPSVVTGNHRTVLALFTRRQSHPLPLLGTLATLQSLSIKGSLLAQSTALRSQNSRLPGTDDVISSLSRRKGSKPLAWSFPW